MLPKRRNSATLAREKPNNDNSFVNGRPLNSVGAGSSLSLRGGQGRNLHDDTGPRITSLLREVAGDADDERQRAQQQGEDDDTEQRARIHGSHA
ncbi:MAG: hypothetical protein ABL883_03420 [Terricaulis sp.]